MDRDPALSDSFRQIEPRTKSTLEKGQFMDRNLAPFCVHIPKRNPKPNQIRKKESLETSRPLGFIPPKGTLNQIDIGKRTVYGQKYSPFKFTRRYGLLRGPTSSCCGGLRPWLFLPFGQKKDLSHCLWLF